MSKQPRVGLTNEPWLWGFGQLEKSYLHTIRMAWQAFASCPEWPDSEQYTKVFQQYAGTGIKVETQLKPSSVEEYCAAIFLDHTVPTRFQNWHDFLNLLMWMEFPDLKFHLHRMQWQALQNFPKTSGRGRPPVNDVITMFDEGGAILPVLAEDLEAAYTLLNTSDHQAKAEWVREKSLAPHIFGHGLYESLLAGKEQVYALALLVPVARDWNEQSPREKHGYLNRMIPQIWGPEEFLSRTQMGTMPIASHRNSLK